MGGANMQRLNREYETRGYPTNASAVPHGKVDDTFCGKPSELSVRFPVPKLGKALNRSVCQMPNHDDYQPNTLLKTRV